ncbi:MAG: cation:proton antiporter [Rhizobiaceae bacterium]
MGHEGNEVWLKDALVFLFAAGVLVPLLRLARVPPVLGFLLAGLALGPFGMGALAETFPALSYFTISDAEAAQPFAELGVLFLLFLLGLEMSFEKLWAMRRMVVGAGATQALVSAVAIGAAAMLLGVPAPAAIAIGLGLALSSTAIVMQLLSDQHRTASAVGRTALAVLLFQDVLVAPILILVGFLSADGEASLWRVVLTALAQGVAAIAVIWLVGRFVLRGAFRIAASAGGRDFLMGLTLLTVVGFAVITAGAGLSLALGAFLGGLLLGETEFKHQTEVDLEPFKGLLLGLFFLTVGTSLDLAAVWAYLPVVAGGLAALIVVKGAIAYLACRLFAGNQKVSLEAALLLAPAGEFAFVVFTTASAGGLFPGETAAVATAIAGLSMMLTPALAAIGRQLAGRRQTAGPDAPEPADYADLAGHVVVAGFGRVGHTVARILDAEKAEIVALDQNADLVARERKAGWKVYVGDASRPEILECCGAKGASLFIVTVDDADDASAIVKAARAARPDATILVRARDTDHAMQLVRAGATFVIPDAIEAGLQLAERALRDYGYTADAVRERISAERDQEYRRAQKG